MKFLLAVAFLVIHACCMRSSDAIEGNNMMVQRVIRQASSRYGIPHNHPGSAYNPHGGLNAGGVNSLRGGPVGTFNYGGGGGSNSGVGSGGSGSGSGSSAVGVHGGNIRPSFSINGGGGGGVSGGASRPQSLVNNGRHEEYQQYSLQQQRQQQHQQQQQQQQQQLKQQNVLYRGSNVARPTSYQYN